MKAQHTLRRRTFAAAIPALALLATAVLGGCSVAGGVNGSVVGGQEPGAHIGVNVDFGVLDAARRSSQRRYDGQTVYVVPDHRASP